QDYFVARALFELDTPTSKDVLLNQEKMLVVNDQAVLQFLAERVQQNQSLKEQLLGFVEESKINEEFRIATANAMTILIKARIHFSNKILTGIRISKADLSYGVFDQTQLHGADLTEVNFRGVWLRGANLRNAKLANAKFGEWPWLQPG